MGSNSVTRAGVAFEIAMTVGQLPHFPNVSPQEWNPEKLNTRIDCRKNEVELAHMDLNDNSEGIQHGRSASGDEEDRNDGSGSCGNKVSCSVQILGS
jgi:hypothetical protein